MTQQQIKIVLTALLHDIGKVAYTEEANIAHGLNGYRFLKNIFDNIDFENDDFLKVGLLNSVKNHHNYEDCKTDDISSILYLANKISGSFIFLVGFASLGVFNSTHIDQF